ncbi:MAG: hypothetical protein ACKOEM_04890, partial [Planctomycetia bacterium]
REKNATEGGAGRFEKTAPDARAAPPEAHESLIGRKTVEEVPLTGLSFQENSFRGECGHGLVIPKGIVAESCEQQGRREESGQNANEPEVSPFAGAEQVTAEGSMEGTQPHGSCGSRP